MGVSSFRAIALSVCVVAVVLLLPSGASAHIEDKVAYPSSTTFPMGENFRAALASEPPLRPVPRAECGPGAWEERGMQGRITRADHTETADPPDPEDPSKSYAARGFRCNAELVGSHTQEMVDGKPIAGAVGGYKVHRYVDDWGNECAYYDTSLLPPTNVGDANLGVKVLDMNDPSNPQLTATLTSPAMVSPHESLIISEERGLLMAVAGNLSQTVLPGQVDIYNINVTPELGCRAPVLMSSTPLGIWGHESGLAPDGNTFYASSLSNETVSALDISNPLVPELLVHQQDVAAHGITISEDGNTAYVARGQNSNGFEIYDVSSIQNREDGAQMEHVSKLTWDQMSVPQSTVAITVDGHPFVIESDEFLRNGQDRTGASRIIDIADPENPFVVSNLRLEVHQEENRVNGQLEDDPGTTANGNNPFSFAQHYTGHFCNVPTKVDPPIVACGMSISGLRIFDIQDPYNPKEVAYYTAPVQERVFPEGSNWAYGQPAFAPERREVWYAEAYTGFYAVKLSEDVWPQPEEPVDPVDPGDPGDPGDGGGSGGGDGGSGGGGSGGGSDNGGSGGDGGDSSGDDDSRGGSGDSGGDPGAPTGPRENPPLLGECDGEDAIMARGDGSRNLLTGTAFVDRILGRGGDDAIDGLDGDDCIRGGAGDDDIKGGSGDDRITGGKDADRVRGNKGADRIRGGQGDDRLHGAKGPDRLRGGKGDDLLDGGLGKNTYVCGQGNDTVIRGPGDFVHKSCENVRRARGGKRSGRG